MIVSQPYRYAERIGPERVFKLSIDSMLATYAVYSQRRCVSSVRFQLSTNHQSLLFAQCKSTEGKATVGGELVLGRRSVPANT
jgi:hypothetical protein